MTPSKNKKTHHIETSRLICKANRSTAFYMTRTSTAKYFQTDYNTEKRKKIRKKLDIRDYCSFPMSVVSRETLHLQYKPYTTYMDNY